MSHFVGQNPIENIQNLSIVADMGGSTAQDVNLRLSFVPDIVRITPYVGPDAAGTITPARDLASQLYLVRANGGFLSHQILGSYDTIGGGITHQFVNIQRQTLENDISVSVIDVIKNTLMTVGTVVFHVEAVRYKL